VVAVQVEVLRVGPLAHAADRAVLDRPVRHSHALVAVRVVDGRDEQHEGIEQLLVLALREFAQQHQQRLLPSTSPAWMLPWR
jgi:hypothetical protein